MTWRAYWILDNQGDSDNQGSGDSHSTTLSANNLVEKNCLPMFYLYKPSNKLSVRFIIYNALVDTDNSQFHEQGHGIWVSLKVSNPGTREISASRIRCWMLYLYSKISRDTDAIKVCLMGLKNVERKGLCMHLMATYLFTYSSEADDKTSLGEQLMGDIVFQCY